MATPFIRFPGGVNYVYTEDTNLVDADSAHLQQSIGQWIRIDGIVNPIRSESVIAPAFGTKHGTGEISTTNGTLPGQMGLGSTSSGSVPATPGVAYRFSIALASSTTGYQAKVYNSYRDSGGGGLAANEIITPELGQTFQRYSVDLGVAPVGTVAQNPQIRMELLGGGRVAGDEFYFDAAMCAPIAVPASPFIPSLQIVGTRFVSEVSDPSPASELYIQGQDQRVGEVWAGDLSQWALHDGADASAPIVAQILATDALRALPL